MTDYFNGLVVLSICGVILFSLILISTDPQYCNADHPDCPQEVGKVRNNSLIITSIFLGLAFTSHIFCERHKTQKAQV